MNINYETYMATLHQKQNPVQDVNKKRQLQSILCLISFQGGILEWFFKKERKNREIYRKID